MAGQVLGLGQRQHVAGGLVERLARVVDDLHGLEERPHRQSRRVAGTAGGREHVVGAGAVVAERHRGVRTDEDRAGVADARCPVDSVDRVDLEVLGGIRVDDLLALVEVVDQRRSPTARPDSAAVTRSACLVAATWRLELGLAPRRASRVESVTRTLAASGSCSAWLIRSAATYAGSAESSARIAISVGPASESMPTTPRSSRFAATP